VQINFTNTTLSVESGRLDVTVPHEVIITKFETRTLRYTTFIRVLIDSNLNTVSSRSVVQHYGLRFVQRTTGFPRRQWKRNDRERRTLPPPDTVTEVLDVDTQRIYAVPAGWRDRRVVARDVQKEVRDFFRRVVGPEEPDRAKRRLLFRRTSVFAATFGGSLEHVLTITRRLA